MLMPFLNSLWLMITTHSLFFIELFVAIIILISLFFFRNLKHAEMPVKNEQRQVDNSKNSSIIITSKDIRAIAGDDVFTTQLDLARAYIEIGKKKLAKKILDHVVLHGNARQKEAAYQLMTIL